MALFSICQVFFVLYFSVICTLGDENEDIVRPYEFAFDIVDFQHRREKKDANGTITGEYGFINGEIYYETAYTTNKNGSFVITKMKNYRIRNIEDAATLMKNKPEVAEILTNALTQACANCTFSKVKNPENSEKKENGALIKQEFKKVTKEMLKSLVEAPANCTEFTASQSDLKDNEIKDVIYNMIRAGKKALQNTTSPDPEKLQKLQEFFTDEVLEKMANDLFYSFNYTIATHTHQENGYRNGKKDGFYNLKTDNGKDLQVKYISNEFGHQPTITYLKKENTNNSEAEKTAPKDYVFQWYPK